MLKHRLKHARALVVAISDPVASRKIVAITRQEAPKEDANDANELSFACLTF